MNANNFNEYWKCYVNEHRNPATRAFHYAGIALSFVALVLLLATGMVFFLPLALIPAQVGAWLGHRLGLRSAGHGADQPIWEGRAALRMFRLGVTGRLAAELKS